MRLLNPLLAASLSVGAALACPLPQTEKAPDGSVRATITFLDDRIYTGAISIDDAGELVLSNNRVGGAAVVDFRAVRSINVLGLSQDVPVQGERDRLTMLRGQQLYGRWAGLTDEALVFESEQFGTLTVPRDTLGDIFPPAMAGGGEASAEDARTADGDSASSAAWRNWEPREANIGGMTVKLEKRGASIERSGDLTGKKISVQVEWKGYPEFRIAIGAAGGEVSAEESADGVALPAGSVVIQPWEKGLAMTSSAGGEFDYVFLPEVLDLDSNAVFHLSATESEVRLVAVELATGERLAVDRSLPLAAPADRMVIEALGRPLEVLFAEVRDPGAGLGEDGMLTITRPLRGTELVSFDAGARRLEIGDGPVSFERSSGIMFISRDRRRQLIDDGRTRGLGRAEARNGEVIEVSNVLFKDGEFVLVSPYSGTPIMIGLEDLVSLRTEARQVAAGGASSFRISFGGKKPVVAGFHGLQSEDGMLRVLRSEPGFKTTVAAQVEGQLEIERTTRSMFFASNAKFPHDIVLGDGQVFPAKVIEITESQLTVETPFREGALSLEQSDVKAVLFEPSQSEFLLSEVLKPKKKANANDARNQFFIGRGGAAPKPDRKLITGDKLERALSVPRNQKDDPGRHLLVARNGDLLRTNVVGRTETHLRIDGGSGGAMEIPIGVLAMWVHVEAPEPGEADVREKKIKTRRSDGDWVINLGPKRS